MGKVNETKALESIDSMDYGLFLKIVARIEIYIEKQMFHSRWGVNTVYMRVRGTGCIRKVRGSKFWHIYYYCNGRQIRESSKSTSKTAAERLLQRRFAEMGFGFTASAQTSSKLKYEEIRQSLIDDYHIHRHNSLFIRPDGTESVQGIADLDGFFAGRRVANITTDVLRAFIRERKKPNHTGYPAQNSTINRNLAMLHCMMNLALREGKIQFIPPFPKLEEKPPRHGFVERGEFDKLQNEFPKRLRPILTFLYLTGRSLGEAGQICWKQVDFDALEIRLEQNGRDSGKPRIIPLDGLEELVAELRQKKDAGESQHDRVFCMTNLRKVWRRACIRRGLGRMDFLPSGREVYSGLLMRDLRRSALRNMIDSGVAEKVAMEISGHTSREVFDRFNIVSTRQLREAMKKGGGSLPAE